MSLTWGPWVTLGTEYQIGGTVDRGYDLIYVRGGDLPAEQMTEAQVATQYPAQVARALNIDAATNLLATPWYGPDWNDRRFRSAVETTTHWTVDDAQSVESRRMGVGSIGVQNAVVMRPFFRTFGTPPLPDGAVGYEYEPGNGRPVSAMVRITYTHGSGGIVASHQWRAAGFPHSLPPHDTPPYPPTGAVLWDGGTMIQGTGVTPWFNVTPLLDASGVFAMESSSTLTSVTEPTYHTGTIIRVDQCLWNIFEAQWTFKTPRVRYLYDVPDDEINTLPGLRQVQRGDALGIGGVPRAVQNRSRQSSLRRGTAYY